MKTKGRERIELDELWSFVGNKKNVRWIWLAICLRTRQIIAYHIGDRSEESCLQFWSNIPRPYWHCFTYSDLWEAYKNVFDSKTHFSVGKESGKTSHIERFINTLRQRVGRLVRKTLSFSKSDFFHDLAVRMFIISYNKDMFISVGI